MTVLSISISETSLFTPIRNLSNSLYEKIQKIWTAFKHLIGGVVRNEFFLPLAKNLSQDKLNLLEAERTFVKNFWNLKKPLNPGLSYHKEIRDQFISKNETLTDLEVNGNSLEVDCCVIESKEAHSKPFYNFVLVLGNISKINDTVMAPYSFISSYLERKKKDPSLPPARFILLSQYDTTHDQKPYLAKTLDEMGLILSKSLEKITKEKGPIHQISGFSMGCIALTAALNHLEKIPHISPPHFHFDRGPSSIEKLSKALGITGFVALALAKFSGWNLDLGEEIERYHQKNLSKTIIISNVKQDAYFPKERGLVEHPLLQEAKIDRLSFDFARQQYVEGAHHTLQNNLLKSYHLLEGSSDILKPEESLSDVIIRRSLKS